MIDNQSIIYNAGKKMYGEESLSLRKFVFKTLYIINIRRFLSYLLRQYCGIYSLTKIY